jgi:hypothetical protein
MRKTTLAFFCMLAAAGCGAPIDDSASKNPFLQDQSNDGKEDSAYMNPDGVEVEVDLEGDVDAPTYRVADGPAVLGQFALTYLRKRHDVYLESLAEDSTADDRAEWLINGTWYAANKLPAHATLKHWRMRGINAVLLFSDAHDDAMVGKILDVTAPMKPFSLMDDVGDQCADYDADIPLDQEVYWYLWNPDHDGCKATTQTIKVTVSKTLATGNSLVYPEFDKLTADKKITAVILFGQIGHDDTVSPDDVGFQGLKRMATWLKQAKFTEGHGPVGRRFSKLVHGITVQIDLYAPTDFAGLDDFAHFSNFQKALSEHEIVAYDGHSMLGASDFWAKPTYPSFYQVFLYGGCLGYEYYVRPILEGKKGWANLDVMSSVVEVSAGANEFAGPFLAKMIWALDHGYRASWRDMLVAVRKSVGDSTFGVSGVRDNCFTPTGTRCH